MLRLYLVGSRRVGDSLVYEPRIEPETIKECSSHFGLVRLESMEVEGFASHRVPAVEVVHARPSQQGPNAHHRPAIGPLAFPRMLLALGTVHLFEAKELPVDGEAGLSSDLSDPE